MILIKKVYNIFINILLSIIIIIFSAILILKCIGYTPYTVLSGSMEPTYKTGSIVFVKEVEPEEIKINDVITFVADENLTVVTHRVQEINTEEKCFYTKGDANKLSDEAPVLFRNLIGIATFSIPYAGFVLNAISTTPLKFVLIGLLAMIIILGEITKNNRKNVR